MDTSNLPAISVTEFTVSYAFDTHRSGRKASHFVSMRFSAEQPLTVEEAQAAAMSASVTVTRATIYHALARGELSVEEANEMISNMKRNHDEIYERKLAKILSKEDS